MFFLQKSSSDATQRHSSVVHCKVAEAVLHTLAAYVDWISIVLVIDENGTLMHMLCTMLHDDELRIAAVECLLVITNRKVTHIYPYCLAPCPYCLAPCPYCVAPCPYCLAPCPYCLAPCPYCLAPCPYCLAPCPYCLAPCPYSLVPCPYCLAPCPYSLAPCPYCLAPCPYCLAPCPNSIAPCPIYVPPCPNWKKNIYIIYFYLHIIAVLVFSDSWWTVQCLQICAHVFIDRPQICAQILFRSRAGLCPNFGRSLVKVCLTWSFTL